MDWFSVRRRLFGGSKKIVTNFEEFMLDSSIVQSFYARSLNTTIPIDTKNCVRYVISMATMTTAMSIDKIDNGVVTNLFSYNKKGTSPIYPNITLTAYDTSSILFNVNCLGVVIDPMDFSISSCDDFFRSVSVIDAKNKSEASGTTAEISNPYGKGATYVIAALGNQYHNGARLVKVVSDVSFVSLAHYGVTSSLLTGVDATSSGTYGNWWVYCYEDYEGVSNDTYAEAIYALSFNE